MNNRSTYWDAAHPLEGISVLLSEMKAKDRLECRILQLRHIWAFLNDLPLQTQ